ncbi:hypothetical protein EYF80_015443 [Liparis tanakae]|uniref:Uncharacterized protein n=1 Tax=Liparis tanakae TaxID=230148 RepID=A0A4Z2I916_9TELE|nr:hypothetical protein EYF80_015443 [Liparis tanakae]
MSETEQGWAGRDESNLKLTLCNKLILLEAREFSVARGQTFTNERRSKMPDYIHSDSPMLIFIMHQHAAHIRALTESQVIELGTAGHDGDGAWSWVEDGLVLHQAEVGLSE